MYVLPKSVQQIRDVNGQWSPRTGPDPVDQAIPRSATSPLAWAAATAWIPLKLVWFWLGVVWLWLWRKWERWERTRDRKIRERAIVVWMVGGTRPQTTNT